MHVGVGMAYRSPFLFVFIDVEVFCAETVMNPMQLYPKDNVNILPPADEIKFLLTLRYTVMLFIVQ